MSRYKTHGNLGAFDDAPKKVVRSSSVGAVDDELKLSTRAEAVEYLSHMKVPNLRVAGKVTGKPSLTPIVDYNALLQRVEFVREGEGSLIELETELEFIPNEELKAVGQAMIKLLK